MFELICLRTLCVHCQEVFDGSSRKSCGLCCFARCSATRSSYLNEKAFVKFADMEISCRGFAAKVNFFLVAMPASSLGSLSASF